MGEGSADLAVAGPCPSVSSKGSGGSLHVNGLLGMGSGSPSKASSLGKEGRLLEVAAQSARAKLERRVGAALEEHQKALLDAARGLLEARRQGDGGTPTRGCMDAAQKPPVQYAAVAFEHPPDEPLAPEEQSGADCGGSGGEQASNDGRDASPEDSDGTGSDGPPMPRSDRRMPTNVSIRDVTVDATMSMPMSVSGRLAQMKGVRKTILKPGVSGSRSTLNLVERNGRLSFLCMSKYAEWLKRRHEFEVLIAVLIMANAVSIGIEADWCVRNPEAEVPKIMRAMDWAFVVIFASEIVLRMVAERATFISIRNSNVRWNIFDTCIVLLTLLGEVDFDTHMRGFNFSVARVFRVFRLCHVLRVVRLMKDFRELRLMVSGMMNCGKTLLWSLIILLAVTYIFAIWCLQVTADWLRTNGGDDASPSLEETTEFIEERFRSLPVGIYTLMQATLGGVNWGVIADPMHEVSLLLAASFPLYIILTTLVVLNIITAAFVDAASRTSQNDETSFIENLDEQERWVKRFQALFDNHDHEHTHSLDLDEFEEVTNNWRAQVLFKEIGLDLDHCQPKALFMLFDLDGDGRIDTEEFAQGITKFRGSARSLDMFRQFYNMNRKIDAIIEHIAESDDIAQEAAELSHLSCDFSRSQEHHKAVL